MLKLPLLRGIVVLFETLVAGMDALSFSADQVEAATRKDEGGSKAARRGSAGSKLATGMTFAFALLFGMGLFIALPHGLSALVGRAFGGLSLDNVAFHALTGAFKLAIFVSYLGLLSLLPDVRRVFMYHGAEHKAIATYEAGEPLDVAHARTHTTFHARCGTSFLLVVVLFAVALFVIVFPLLPGLSNNLGGHATAIGIKILLMLPVGGAAYELNRWAASRLQNPLVRALVAPGFLMQRLTTREPNDEMLEVALGSLKAALIRNEAAERSDGVVVYKGYADLQSRLT